jgi:lysophospholipase L1-like esterase
MRYILFGASIAFGVTDYENGGWAGHLRKFADNQEKDNHFTNLAISGDTSRGLLNRLETEARLRIRDKPSEEFTIIITIGTNDSRINKLDAQNNISEEEFRENMLKLIKIAKKLVKKVVILGLFPIYEEKTSPFKEQKYYSNERVKRYNDILKECSEQENVPFKNFFPSWKNKNLKELFDDGLHPNKEGHLMAYKEIKEFLFS